MTGFLRGYSVNLKLRPERSQVSSVRLHCERKPSDASYDCNREVSGSR